MKNLERKLMELFFVIENGNMERYKDKKTEIVNILTNRDLDKSYLLKNLEMANKQKRKRLIK